MTDNLDKNLVATWNIYSEYLKECIIEKRFSIALEFAEKLIQPELSFTTTDYPLYWALLNAYNEDFPKTLEILNKAHDYGYRGFWRFDPDSHGWGNKTSDDYFLLEPIHKNDLLQKYVKSVYTGKVESWGFDLSNTCLLYTSPSPRDRG